MHELPKSLMELQLEEEIHLLKRENMELRWEAGMRPGDLSPGLSEAVPTEVSEGAFKTGELRLAVGAGWERKRGGVQYFGYVSQPDRYEIGLFTSTDIIWNRTGALFHLDKLNRNIQGELLKALSH